MVWQQIVSRVELAFLAAITVSQVAQAVEATHLSPIPLDVSAKCNSTFFRGMDEFAGTAFVVPRVILGRGPDRGLPIEIIPASGTPGTPYMMNVYLYFPSGDEINDGHGASSRSSDPLACNWQQVKTEMNKSASESQRINRIAFLPLTNIELAIPGIRSVGVVGRGTSADQTVDVLNYMGQSLAFTFRITEEERKDFESRVVRANGLQAQVRFGFDAGKRDGSVRAFVDADSLMRELDAAAHGETHIAKANLSAILKSALNSQSIQVEVQQGSREGALDKISEKIFDKVMSSLKEMKDATDPVSPQSAPEDAKVSLKAVATFIANHYKSGIIYNNYSAPKMAVALVPLNMQTVRVAEPGLQQVEVSAGYKDPSSGIDIKEGDTISIAAGYSLLENITYKESRTWVTTSDIQMLGLSSLFPNLVDTGVSVEDQNINGTTVAVGTYNSYLKTWSPPLRWSRTQRFPVRTRGALDYFDNGEGVMSALPVRVGFSRIGLTSWISFQQLMKEGRFWKSNFDVDTGRLILTAKQDLGVLQFHSIMNSKEDLDYGPPIVLDQVSEWEVKSGAQTKLTQTAALKSDNRPIIKQRTIVFYVGLPMAGGKSMAAPVLTETAPQNEQKPSERMDLK